MFTVGLPWVSCMGTVGHAGLLHKPGAPASLDSVIWRRETDEITYYVTQEPSGYLDF